MKQEILSCLSTECPWRDTLYWYDTVDSTNIRAKLLANEGAPHGTVLIAGAQTQGRGRLGRQFHSPAKSGVYLSVILRPNCKPEQLMHLTCLAGLAAAQAVEKVCGCRIGLKWINDLVLTDKKLGGILTALSCDRNGIVDYAVVGIGINCNQRQEEFPEELQSIATSVYAATGKTVSPSALAAALIEALAELTANLLRDPASVMDAYRKLCITLGRQIKLVNNETERRGIALDVRDDGSLLVELEDGSREYVSTGEASVRGLYGYL